MKGGGQQQQGSGNSLDVLWISAMLVLGMLFLWYKAKAQIISIVYVIKIHELDFVVQCLLWANKIGLPVAEQITKIKGILGELSLLNPASSNFQSVENIFNQVGSYYVIPTCIFALLMIVYLMVFNKSSRFKATFSMSKLRKQEHENWPYINPILKTDLIKKDLDDGPFAMSKQPLQFALENEIVIKGTKDGLPIVTLDEAAAFACFSRSLGNYWTGRLDCLPNYGQALFAIFAAKGNDDEDGSRQLLWQIAESSSSGNLNFGGTNALIAKHIKSQTVGRAVGAHAYCLTALASMLELARTGGVLSMAEILWLKAVDRRLWYMLNSVGRQTPFIEAAGPFGHWVVEKRLRRPLKVPMVHEAVAGLRQALEETKYNPDGN